MKKTLITSNISLSSIWGSLLSFILSTSNRIYIGFFGLLVFSLLGLATSIFMCSSMHGSLVTSSLLAESERNSSLNSAYNFGQEDETYSISATLLDPLPLLPPTLPATTAA